MKRSELMEVAIALGIVVAEDATVEQLIALIKASKQVAEPVVADAPSVSKSGKSHVVSFFYADDSCIATLANGVRGRIGNAKICSLKAMLSLKDSDMAIAYSRDKNEPAGAKYPWYNMEFAR